MLDHFLSTSKAHNKQLLVRNSESIQRKKERNWFKKCQYAAVAYFLSFLDCLYHLFPTYVPLKSRSRSQCSPLDRHELHHDYYSGYADVLNFSWEVFRLHELLPAWHLFMFPGLQAQSTSLKKEHTCSSDRGKAQPGRGSREWTRVVVNSEKTQSEEESPARILPVCTSHPYT